LKVVHALGWYFPDSCGGTEVYVDALARSLAARGVESVVAAATDGTVCAYEWQGIGVHRYRVPPPEPDEIAAARPPAGIGDFEAWLRAQNAEVYHQHSWTRGCGLAHLRVAKAIGLETVVTVHVPSVLCLRGTMMLNGSDPCDGRIDVERCSECWGSARGIPRGVARAQGHHPAATAALARLVPDSRLRTALRTPELVARRQGEIADLARSADRIVAVCRWLYDALARNAVPPQKLVHCAHGISPADRPGTRRDPSQDTFRIGFLGRWDRDKGVHVLVQAARNLPRELPVHLRIHALPGDGEYEGETRALVGGDPRIELAAPIDRDEVPSALAEFDALAVPSMTLETGPLVALEAFAAGVPVIGSNLGGIAELVTPDRGWLVPAGDVAAWTGAIARIAAAPATERLQPPAPARSQADVAREMAALYHDIGIASEATYA